MNLIQNIQNQNPSQTNIQTNSSIKSSSPVKNIPKEEIEETYTLLRDFGINIKKSSIPRNISIFDLHIWRKAKIKAYLQS